MLQMVEAISHDYVSKIENADKIPAIRAQCETGHHGLTRPPPLNAVLAESLYKDGLARRSLSITNSAENTTAVIRFLAQSSSQRRGL